MEVNDREKLKMRSELSQNWAELTRECLIDIFSRLSFEERWIGPLLVCKTWMNTCQDSSLNTILDLETRFLSVPESINWWNPEFEEKIDSILVSVVDWSQGGLKKIQIRHCSDRALSYAAERCPNLETLWIKSCPNITDTSMEKIASSCPKLKELDISYSYGISHNSLKMIGEQCHNLNTLKRNLLPRLGPNLSTIVAPIGYFQKFPRYGSIDARIIGKYMPNLKHLELQFSTLTGNGLEMICEGCLNLEYLDVSGCISLAYFDVNDITSNLKNMKEIKTDWIAEINA